MNADADFDENGEGRAARYLHQNYSFTVQLPWTDFSPLAEVSLTQNSSDLPAAVWGWNDSSALFRSSQIVQLKFSPLCTSPKAQVFSVDQAVQGVVPIIEV
jgi:hypothetical protein